MFAATGTRDVHDWPSEVQALEPLALVDTDPATSQPGEVRSLGGEAETPSSSDARWFQFVPLSQADVALEEGVMIATPLWAGLRHLHGVWGGPSCELTDLLAATVSFRQVCSFVQDSGMMWLPGKPSNAGIQLMRQLLPNARFSTVQTDSGPAFAAAHPRCNPQTWRPSLQRLRAFAPLVTPLRASLVYHTRSLARG